MAARMPGLDVGTACLLANTPEFKPTRIKTVSWLTLLNNERLALAGGLDALRAQLPSSHFAFYRYGDGVVIQAGAYPYIAGDAEDSRPAPYVLLNHALKGIRYETIGSLHGGSHDGELRLVGWAADQWLKRLDVEDSELPAGATNCSTLSHAWTRRTHCRSARRGLRFLGSKCSPRLHSL